MSKSFDSILLFDIDFRGVFVGRHVARDRSAIDSFDWAFRLRQDGIFGLKLGGQETPASCTPCMRSENLPRAASWVVAQEQRAGPKLSASQNPEGLFDINGRASLLRPPPPLVD